MIKDLREQVADCLAPLLSQSITNGGDATHELAEDTMIAVLTIQLEDVMNRHIATSKKKEEEFTDMDDTLDDILEKTPPLRLRVMTVLESTSPASRTTEWDIFLISRCNIMISVV